jgi:hypothetical protein
MKHPHWKYGETSVFVEDISISNGLFCKLLFPSLYQLVTKNQVHMKFLCFGFCCCRNSKEKPKIAVYLRIARATTKKHLVVGF